MATHVISPSHPKKPNRHSGRPDHGKIEPLFAVQLLAGPGIAVALQLLHRAAVHPGEEEDGEKDAD